MSEMVEKFLMAWIPLFVAVDPIGLAPFFLGVVQGVEPGRSRKIARQAILTAALVVVGFMFLGEFVFRALGITVADFQIAGGLILLVLAVRDMLGRGGEKEILGEDFGVVPLGLPLIAGPATLATVLMLMHSVGLGMTLLSLGVNLVLVALVFWYGERLAGWIGMTGLRAFSKIIALLLAAYAVNMMTRGWQQIAAAAAKA
ncbi:MAG: MarC family protein [Verrucomicrobiae bacterium]|nr:MarC family protein [Verrucomicrobiae bacterium]